jgi:hypothetical protein
MEGCTWYFLGRGPLVHGKRRNTHAYVHEFNPFSSAQCAVVLDIATHVGARDGQTDMHEMCARLTESHTFMCGFYLDSCALVRIYAKNRRAQVCTYLGESRALDTRLRG